MIKNRIYPSCLPIKTIPSVYNQPTDKGWKLGVQSGWSNPPPYYHIQEKAPLYAENYRDFSKQWHYRMEFLNCTDPIYVGFVNETYYYETPSDTFYPPGVVCASQFHRHICPTSGESGSPLMAREDGGYAYEGYGRFITEGILSFIKGCTVYGFGKYFELLAVDIDTLKLVENSDTKTNILLQLSDNPLVYTKLHCYLPWVAEQYDLDFEFPQETEDDPACTIGRGNPEDVGDVKCTNTPSTAIEILEGIERPCLFPFYMDGQLINDTCFKFNADTFLDPVSRCPIWEITTKINGINSYNSSDTRLIFGGHCVNAVGVLDPSLTCRLIQRRTAFSKCKNNCRGGRNYHF